jgi:hypothetical protein
MVSCLFPHVELHSPFNTLTNCADRITRFEAAVVKDIGLLNAGCTHSLSIWLNKQALTVLSSQNSGTG